MGRNGSGSADTPTIEPAERTKRLIESQDKYLAPFELDVTLRAYSPQENVDLLAHPRVAQWIDWMSSTYEPNLPDGKHVWLFVPCTKTKPYVCSLEHRRINGALEAAGFRSTKTVNAPPGFPDLSPLVKGKTVIHRSVLSEPLGVVPYEHLYEWDGGQSPASSYDDAGLFEHRGTSVSPWHPRHSATPDPKHPGKWRWGPNEVHDYVVMHNAMSAAIAAVVDRIGNAYSKRIAWVAPGLTHRSFVLANHQRSAEGVKSSRRVNGSMMPLVGVNDLTDHHIDVRPSRAELAPHTRQGVALPFLEPAMLDVLVQAVR
jgi:hypothetical protein